MELVIWKEIIIKFSVILTHGINNKLFNTHTNIQENIYFIILYTSLGIYLYTSKVINI